MSRRRCELEQAAIRAMTLGNKAWLNTIGELDWEREKEFYMEETTLYDLNYYRDLCHTANVSWWPENKKTRNQGQALMLCVSELAESLEGHRKSLSDDKLPHRLMAEVELIDFLIRAFDTAGGMGWDLTVGDTYKLNGENLSKIAQKIPERGLVPPQTFADGLMRITGFLVDCYRHRTYGEKQALNLKLAVHTALAIGRDSKYDIQGAFDEKMSYNAHRADHKKEHREAAGGKKY